MSHRSAVYRAYQRYRNVNIPGSIEAAKDIKENGFSSRYLLPLFAQHLDVVTGICSSKVITLPIDDCLQSSAINTVSVCYNFDPNVSSNFRTFFSDQTRSHLQQLSARCSGPISQTLYAHRKELFTYPIPIGDVDIPSELQPDIFDEYSIQPIDWQDIIEILPQKLRLIVNLLYKDSLSVTEAAKVAGVSRRSLHRRKNEISRVIKDSLSHI